MTAPHAPTHPAATPPPVVFITYSYDTDAHKAWVLKLAEDLCARGVDAVLDQYEVHCGDDLAQFMRRSVLESDRVLLVCTPTYVNKAENGVGGVGFEAQIVSAELVKSTDTRKFVPIVRQRKAGCGPLPAYLGARRYIDFCDDAAYGDRLDELARELHGQKAISKPPLGPNPYVAAGSPPSPHGRSPAGSPSGRQTTAPEPPRREPPADEANASPGAEVRPFATRTGAAESPRQSIPGNARADGAAAPGLRLLVRIAGERIALARRFLRASTGLDTWLPRGTRALYRIRPRLHIHLLNAVTAVLPLLVLSADTKLVTWATTTALSGESGRPALQTASRFASSTHVPAIPARSAGVDEPMRADTAQPAPDRPASRDSSVTTPAAAVPRVEPRAPERRPPPPPPPREPEPAAYGFALDEIHAARSAYERGDYSAAWERAAAVSQQLQSLGEQFPGSSSVRQLQDSATEVATVARNACQTELDEGTRRDCD
jgi:hypothetical protein